MRAAQRERGRPRGPDGRRWDRPHRGSAWLGGLGAAPAHAVEIRPPPLGDAVRDEPRHVEYRSWARGHGQEVRCGESARWPTGRRSALRFATRWDNEAPPAEAEHRSKRSKVTGHFVFSSRMAPRLVSE